MRGGTDGHTQWEQAGTVLGSRSEEGGDKRGAGQAEANMGNFGPSLHRSTLEALEKNTGQNYIPRDSQDSRLGREREEEERKMTATGRSMRQTDSRTGRTGRKCGGHHSTNPCREDRVKPSQAEAWRNL